MTAPAWLRTRQDGTEIPVKAVPNSSRDRIVGPHGDRLKITVAAPPEAGKANDRIAELLAKALAVPTRSVRLIAGAAAPAKTFLVQDLSPAQVAERLGLG